MLWKGALWGGGPVDGRVAGKLVEGCGNRSIATYCLLLILGLLFAMRGYVVLAHCVRDVNGCMCVMHVWPMSNATDICENSHTYSNKVCFCPCFLYP